MVNVFIGIDVGTQGTKAIAYLPSSTSSHVKGKILARSSSSYNLLPNNGVVGRAEQDPNDWIIAVQYTLKELVSKIGLVAPFDDKNDDDDTRYVLSGIGISGQQHGMVLLDSTYKPLRPAKLWCDVEASDEAEWIQKSCDNNRKWNHVLPGFTAPKVLWTIKNEPEIWNDARWCVLPHDYINLILRGANDDDDDNATSCLDEIQPTTDRGDASGSGVYNVITNQYCMELTNAIDPTGRYAKALPTILEPLDICGSLSLQWMKDIGLLSNDQSSTPYIPISVGSGDNMCSALGVGCVKPGMAVLSLGTSGTIFGVSHSSPSSKVAPFADASGRYLLLVCIMSCTGVLNSVLDSFFNGRDGSESSDSKDNHKIWTHEEATKMAMQHSAGCHGITFLPYLTPGERTPDWPHASGALLGLTASNMAMAAATRTAAFTNKDNSSPINPMAGLIYRAAMEGITYLLAEGVSTMKQACGDGFQPTCLLVVGGGSHNQLWRQMLADVLRIDLRFPKEKESAALGAAFQVGAAVEATKVTQGKLTMEEYILKQSIDMEDEIIRPTTDKETIELYKEGKKRYCNFATKLFGDLN